MKFFITGIAGFLGSHLADNLIEKGHEVTGCDNLMGGYLDNVPKEADFFQYDCCNYKKMVEIIKGANIVYHCAATAYEGLSVFSPVFVTENNFHATTSVVTAAIANNVQRFIYCSSMSRYGTNEVPFKEDMEPRPQDPYGISKWASEKVILNLCKVHDVDPVIAVPHNIIGPRQKYDDPFRNVASIFINLMLQGRQPYIYGDGEQMRCFSFVQDTVGCLEKMAFQDNVIGEIINVGPDEEFITINHLAKTIAELLDFDLKPKYTKKRPQEVMLANCSADKARKLLGYETKYTLKDGLQEMLDWIKNRGAKPFEYHIPIEINNGKLPATWSEKLM